MVTKWTFILLCEIKNNTDISILFLLLTFLLKSFYCLPIHCYCYYIAGSDQEKIKGSFNMNRSIWMSVFSKNSKRKKFDKNFVWYHRYSLCHYTLFYSIRFIVFLFMAIFMNWIEKLLVSFICAAFLLKFIIWKYQNARAHYFNQITECTS